MALPLAGIRVLDVTNVLAGPFCSYQLVLMGAEVIKIEQPGSGDLARRLGADRATAARLMGASFVAVNAGKQSITLNLKAPRGKEIRTLRHRCRIVVRRIALGATHCAPVHAVAFRYQSMICRPCQNSVPGRAAMCASAFSNQPIRCGTPLI